MKEIQAYELEGTNLLYIVKDSNSDATYYNKSNLTVEAVNGFVVIKNEGEEVLKELPRDFVNPIEKSVVDLVEIIQGYINNLIPVENEELDALKELIDGQAKTNDMVFNIRALINFNVEIFKELQEQTKILKKIYNPE